MGDEAFDSFPRQYARTQRLTLGEPRNVAVVANSLLFLRSPSGSSAANQLWRADLETGDEVLLVDPATVLADSLSQTDKPTDNEMSAAERARRERMREGAGGITSYGIDGAETRVVFTLGGLLFTTVLATGVTVALDVPGPVFDPNLSPTGDRVAYVRDRSVIVVDLSTSQITPIAGPESAGRESDTVSWGSADFVAAEEMHRFRGFWWSPDGDFLAICRVDEAPVTTWYISDPATPSHPSRPVRYPAAGTPNATVDLYIIAADGRGQPIRADIDTKRWPYLASVSWNGNGLVAVVQDRSQQDLHVLNISPTDGSATTIWEDHDDAWVELVPGSGVAIGPGQVVMCADRDGARRLVIAADGEATAVSPPDVQVRSILAANSRRVVVVANPIDDATVQQVCVASLPDGAFTVLTDEPGVFTAAIRLRATGSEQDGSDPERTDVLVLRRSDVHGPGGRWELPSGGHLRSFAETPLTRPNLTLLRSGVDKLATVVLLPHGHNAHDSSGKHLGSQPLPVLLDPYGGPHAQRVVQSYNAYVASQWFADQGFAVVITDGRGTPGRGSAFERAVHHNLADGVLEDQIAGLHAAAERYEMLDLSRVAIRGWSFGGYLAALAVLKRPDVFHAAIAGAPVTEWRLYDTHYTERYLGDPNQRPDVYDANSLLPLAPDLTRPLLLIHGLADDNVVAAHTLQLSAALLAAGRPHEVLPLVGVTHMTPQEVVAENLLLHQLDFLRRALGLSDDTY